MNIVDFTISKFNSIYDKLTPKRFYPILLCVLIVLGLSVFIIPGIPNGHDLYYHCSRLHTMEYAFRHGEFPAMINHGAIGNYGYATGLFYPDLFLYPAVLLMLCGLNIIASYKCMIVLWMLLIALSAYYCAQKLSESFFGAFAVALLYTWSSYLASDLFIRAALGEVFSFAFFPWIILGLYEIILGNPQKFYYFSFGFLGLLYAHNLSLAIVAFLCAVIILFNFVRFLREPKRIFYLLISPIPTILIGLAVLVPFMEQFAHAEFLIKDEKNEEILECCMDFLKLFVEIPHSKQVRWKPAGIGTIFIITALQRLRFVSKRTPIEIFRDILLIAGFSCMLLSTDLPSWKGYFKPFTIIQAPWRFFFPATGFLAFGCGLTLVALTQGKRAHEHYWLWILLLGCCFSWSINTGYIYAARISEHGMTKDYKPGRPQEASGLHYLLRGSLLDIDLLKRGDVAIPEHPLELSLSHPQRHLLKVSFANNTQDNILEMPKIPYYGYQATLLLPDGTRQSLQTGVSENKLLTVSLPGKYSAGDIIVQYRATRLQRLSQILSLLFACVFFTFLLRHHKASKQECVKPL